MRITIDDWAVDVTVGSLPSTYADLRAHARLLDELEIDGEGELLCVGAGRASCDWPEVVVAQRFSPGPDAGFSPEVLVAPDARTLFVGAGTRLLAYDLAAPRRLWEDVVEAGFWGWRRHGDIVVLSAELELAAWTVRGEKLWTTRVEPPWGYLVEGERVRLDVMGEETSFELRRGPR